MSSIQIRTINQKQVGGTVQPLKLGGIQTDGSDAKIIVDSSGAVSLSSKIQLTNAIGVNVY